MRRGIAGGVISVTATMAGAGLASGQEIMRFFSRYGQSSTVLVFCAAAIMTAGGYAIMRYGVRHGLTVLSAMGGWARSFILIAMAVTGGSMLAAMGEISALCVPVRGARWMGMAVLLALACALSRKSLRSLRYTGAVLLPLLVAAFLLCLRVKPQIIMHGAAPPLHSGIVPCAGYALLNLFLSSGVLCEVGAHCDTERVVNRCAAWTGLAMGLLLLLGNAALTRHAPSLEHDALPIVRLLSSYGTAGFILSAAALLFAAFTTLLGGLRTMFLLLPTGFARRALCPLAIALSALIGFQNIVGQLYPLVGWLGLIALIFTKATLPAQKKPHDLREAR